MNRKSVSRSAGQFCPVCGFPMEQTSRFCFRCRHFIDVGQNRPLQPGEVSDEELDHLIRTIREAEKDYLSSADHRRARRAKRILILGIVLTCTILLAAIGLLIVLLGFILLIQTRGAPPQSLSPEETEEVLAKYLVPDILKNCGLEDAQYCHSGCVSALELKRASMMQQAYNEMSGSDSIRAFYHGLPVELCDLHLTHLHQDSAGLSHRRSVFRGTFLICRCSFSLPEPVTVWPRSQGAEMEGGISTGSPDFDLQFLVESRHPQTARGFLTPRLCRALLEISAVCGGSVTLKFMEDGTLYAAVPATKDRFEIGQGDESAVRLRARFTAELQRVTQILDLVIKAQ